MERDTRYLGIWLFWFVWYRGWKKYWWNASGLIEFLLIEGLLRNFFAVKPTKLKQCSQEIVIKHLTSYILIFEDFQFLIEIIIYHKLQQSKIHGANFHSCSTRVSLFNKIVTHPHIENLIVLRSQIKRIAY